MVKPVLSPPYRVQDNSTVPPEADAIREDYENIIGKSIGELRINNPGLWVFNAPESEDFLKQKILNDIYGKLRVGNIMGFIGHEGKRDLSIISRFSKDQDFFLYYMLEKAYDIHLVEWKHGSSWDSVFDFSAHLFTSLLNKAVSQGIYKSYQFVERNATSPKGVIDIKRQIKENTPFTGNISYNTREYTSDNVVTQLIRHTIEYIRTRSDLRFLLSVNQQTASSVQAILTVTPSYSRSDRNSIIRANAKPIDHPYYTTYRVLQKNCLGILNHQRIGYGDDSTKRLYGILFDGADLWERYLASLLKEKGFEHHKEIAFFQRQSTIQIDGNNTIVPDFTSEEIVLDAKYKKFNDDKIKARDFYQIVTYMYCLKKKYGGLIYPQPAKRPIGRLSGYGGIMRVIPFRIPQCNDWKEFKKEMAENEVAFLKEINKWEV